MGAAMAPQLLYAADDSGAYDFIRADAAFRATQARPSASPQAAARGTRIGAQFNSALRQFRVRDARGRANVMPADLSPAHPWRVRPAAGAVKRIPLAVSGPEISMCVGCPQTAFGSPLEAILNDTTLRPGDIVITDVGAEVFRGAAHPPYRATDFSDPRESKMLTRKELRLLDDYVGLTPKEEARRAFREKVQAAIKAANDRENALGPHASSDAPAPLAQIAR
ncbi:MAG: hypothetical protein ACHQAY_24005 [Hyphomicrobiales bacterium]